MFPSLVVEVEIRSWNLSISERQTWTQLIRKSFLLLFQDWLPSRTYSVCVSHSTMSDSLQRHGLYSPWKSPGKNTGVGCHFLLQTYST